MSRLRPTLIVASAAMALGPAAAAAQDPPARVAVVERPTIVSAYAGARAWSEASGRRYRLVVVDARGERTVLDRGRSVPFDVDLGPGPRGRLTAVFSRCARESRTMGYLGLPLIDWAGGRGCDVHVWSPGARERRLPAARATYDEYLPSIWKGRVIFARVPSGRRGATPSLVVAPTKGGRLRRVTRGPSGSGRRAALAGIDLRGRDYAFAWAHPDRASGGFTSEIRVGSVGRSRTRLLDTGSTDARTAVWSPSLAGSSTSWLRLVGSSVETLFHVITRPPSAPATSSLTTSVPLFSASHDARTLLVGTGWSARPEVPCPRSQTDGRETCEVLAATP